MSRTRISTSPFYTRPPGGSTGNKSFTITQCTNAQVAALDGSKPAIKITNTKALTIISPDTVGGTIGWNRIDNNAIGIDALGNSNTLTGGSLTGNKGVGVHLGGSSNTLSGATIERSGSHGVLVDGSSNEITSDKSNKNTIDGFFNKAGSYNKYSGNSTQTDGGKEYEFTTSGVNGNGNKADGTNVPGAKGCASFNGGQSCN